MRFFQITMVMHHYFLGILSPESMRLSWTTVENTEDKVSKHWGYGLGWAILPEKHERGCCRDQQKAIAHSGKLFRLNFILSLLWKFRNCAQLTLPVVA
jgi:hypothetical protein